MVSNSKAWWKEAGGDSGKDTLGFSGVLGETMGAEADSQAATKAGTGQRGQHKAAVFAGVRTNEKLLFALL